MPSRPVTAAAVILAAAALAACAAAPPASLAAVARARPRGWRGATTLCRRNARRTVTSSAGTGYVVRNDWWGRGDDQCVVNRNHWANFLVTRSRADSAAVSGFPYILDGCAWGACSPRSALPQRIGRVIGSGRLAVSWWTRGTIHAPGKWNAALDIWIMRGRHRGGQAHGAEVMIWLRTRGFQGTAGWPRARIGGVTWAYAHHLACADRVALTGCWNFLLFRLARGAGHVSRLRLGPFFWYGVRRGLIRRSWWLTAVEAGFEIWQGGTGLGTSWFGVARVRA